MTFEKKLLIAVLAAFLSFWAPFSLAHADSNFLPSPFPLCPTDGKTSGMKWKIAGLYSKMKFDSLNTPGFSTSLDLDVSGLSVLCVKENPEVGKPSFHFGLFGGIVKYKRPYQISALYNGISPMTIEEAGMLDLPHQEGNDIKIDMDGYTLGTSISPSFVLSDRIPGFRPLVFFGSNVQYQKMDLDNDQIVYDQSIQLLRLAKMMGYQYNAYPDRKSTRLNSSHNSESRMPSSA
jgi:hypothetical protein